MNVDSADAVVIGSGPNGLVAAAMLARSGWSVTVLERDAVVGGAVRSDPLTRPGYIHDTCSAFYGLLHASPVFRELGLDQRVEWASFSTPVAAAVRPGEVGLLHADVDATVAELARVDKADGEAWRDLVSWWSRIGTRFLDTTLQPLPAATPGLRLLRAARIRGILDLTKMMVAPVDAVARSMMRTDVGRALIAGGASHADVSVAAAGSTPGALFLALVAQSLNMPVPVGGAARLAEGLAAAVTDAGGSITTGADVVRVIVERGRAVGVETADGRSVSARRAVLADTGPPALFHRLVGDEHLPARFLDGLKKFRQGSGIFKLDVALDGPAPWGEEGLAAAGVIHIVGDLDDMARATSEVSRNLLPIVPSLVVGQQSVADVTRAPAGGHTLWIETHVPSAPKGDGVGGDVTSWAAAADMFRERVVDRLEAFAPGLHSRIVGAAVHTPPDLERLNPNLVGGDLAGGTMALDQQLVFRPVPGWFRYRTPIKRLYLCSASAHPGPGVHGMAGRNCARQVKSDGRRGGLRD